MQHWMIAVLFEVLLRRKCRSTVLKWAEYFVSISVIIRNVIRRSEIYVVSKYITNRSLLVTHTAFYGQCFTSVFLS